MATFWPLFFGCGGDIVLTEECGSLATGPVQIATWWGQEDGSSEAEAASLLMQEFEACNPAAEAWMLHYETKFDLLEAVPRSLGVAPTGEEAGAPTPEPPQQNPMGGEPAVDVVLLNAGWDVVGFTPCSRDGAGGGLMPLDAVLEDDVLTRPLDWQNLADSCGDSWYSVPMGTHRLNTLYVNDELLRTAGCSIEQLGALDSSEEFLSLLADLDAVLVRGQPPSGSTCVRNADSSAASARVGTAPPVESVLSLSTEEAWALSLFAIENLMVARMGYTEYKAFWNGEMAKTKDGLKDTTPLGALLDELARYVRYLPLKKPTMPPPDEASVSGARIAFERVVSGQAVFTVMGDWYEAELDDTDVVTVPFPGTQDVRVQTVDVFTIAHNSPNPSGAAAWLRAISSKHVAEAYVAAKGGAAARTDTEMRPSGVQPLPALPSFIPAGHFDDLGKKLVQWTRAVVEDGQRNDDDLVNYVAREYCSLEGALCDPPVVDVK